MLARTLYETVVLYNDTHFITNGHLGTDLERVNSVVDDVRSVLHTFRIHISTIQQEVAGLDGQVGFSGVCTIGTVRSACMTCLPVVNHL